MSRVVEQLLGYGVASLFALLADMAVLWLLVDRFSWSPFAAAFVSFPVGALVAYVLSLSLAFHEHRLRDRRVEFAGFLAIGHVRLGGERHSDLRGHQVQILRAALPAR